MEFRVWAPRAQAVDVVIEAPRSIKIRMHRAEDGYFVASATGIREGATYKYRIDGAKSYPDPCSKYQPSGPHGPSAIVDTDKYEWADRHWRGVEIRGQVLYELHVGTFTPAGTLDAACAKLEHLRSLGITVIELMPLAECNGRWNWGYDGVLLFAPYHVYGEYDALKRFVDSAHRAGIAVILDVVYNHLGPSGNHLSEYSRDYFTDKYPNEWGRCFNVDGENATPVRDFILANATYWIRDFHLDGLRLDATQSIHDASETHILSELTQLTREAAAPRSIIVIAENEPQDTRQLLPIEQGGMGFDAMWNDDFHHCAHVALTGRREAYFHDYLGRAHEFVSTAKHGYLFQGQYYYWQKKARGQQLRRPPWNFVNYIQNHDQVANSGTGTRLHALTSPARYRAATTLLLLAPQTPMLFMGQEFGSSTPFTFLADMSGELRDVVRNGRRKFLSQFPSLADPRMDERIADPAAIETLQACKLNWHECETHAAVLALHRALLDLRRNDSVLAKQGMQGFDSCVINDHAFALRWFGDGDRLLVVNLGTEFLFAPAPEPLLAPPYLHRWELRFASEDPQFGGTGTVSALAGGEWRFPGESALLYAAVKDEDSHDRS